MGFEDTGTVKLTMQPQKKSVAMRCATCGVLIEIFKKKIAETKATGITYRLCTSCLEKQEKQHTKITKQDNLDLMSQKKAFGLHLKQERFKNDKVKEEKIRENREVLEINKSKVHVAEKISEVEKIVLEEKNTLDEKDDEIKKLKELLANKK